MPFFCTECGLNAQHSFKFCAGCGNNLASSKAAAGLSRSAQNPASWDLSGNVPFELSADIKTSSAVGQIAGKCFSGGLWKNGGGEGQGKMLFLRGGKVCFDIGWVGCVTGRTLVNDGRWHKAGVRNEGGGNYKVLVDGVVDGEGLHSVPDHPDTETNVGKKIGHQIGSGDMAPDFVGELRGVKYGGIGEEEEFEVVVAEPMGKPTVVEALSMRTFNLSESTASFRKIMNKASGNTPRELNGLEDLAPQGKARQSSNYNSEMKASNAIRGSFHSQKGFGGSGTYSHTSANDNAPFWEVALKKDSNVSEVHIYGRPGYARRLKNLKVVLLDSDRSILLEKAWENESQWGAFSMKLLNNLADVKIVRLEKTKLGNSDETTLNINVVQVFGRV